MSGAKSVAVNVAMIAVAIYLVYSMISLQGQLAAEKATLKQKQQQISELTIENEELENLLNNSSDVELIERAARDKLDFVYANEEVYEDSAGK